MDEDAGRPRAPSFRMLNSLAFERHRMAVRERLDRSGQRRSDPGSISWKINREAIVVAGWGRAILLLLAHPAVASGVYDHSSFRLSPLARARRLRSTISAMQSLTFGDTEAMIAAAAAINTIHDRVNGNMPGGSYSAHDPHLQRWVHAALIESILLTYELVVGPLTPAERDAYCAEAAIMEPLLGMPDGWLPRDSASLARYTRGMHRGEELAVNDTSRTLARAVLFPPMWRAAWPLFRALQLLTLGTLTPAMRAAYGFAWSARDEKALARVVRLLQMSRRVLPPFARQWPMARRTGNRNSSIRQRTIAHMKAHLTLLIGLSAVMGGTPAYAQDKTAGIDRIFSWATPATPGCSVAVAKDGALVATRAYGLADMERDVPITPTTLFDAGSVVKQFVAAATLLLVEDGRLSLTEDIRKYIPELPDYGHTITLDHLLTHTSGIRDWDGLMPSTNGKADALTLTLRQRGLNFAPGEEWSYSNSGYVLLKEIVARTSGMSVADFTRTRIFEPLGMTSTRYVADMQEVVKHRALAYDKAGSRWKLDVQTGHERGGGGALLVTAGDLILWNQALTDARRRLRHRQAARTGDAEQRQEGRLRAGLVSRQQSGWSGDLAYRRRRRLQDRARTVHRVRCFCCRALQRGGGFGGDDEIRAGNLRCVRARHGGLIGRANDESGPGLPLRPVDRDTFQIAGVILRFTRDAAGKVVGITYSNPVVRNIAYVRVSGPKAGS